MTLSDLPGLTADLAPEDIPIEDLDDVERLLRRYGQLESEIEQRQNERDEEIEKIRDRHAPVIARRQQRANAIGSALKAHLKAHRDQLLEETGGSKTIELKSGKVSYVKGRDRLVYTDDKEAIIERLHAIGESDLIVVKEKLRKTPLMDAWPRLQGRLEGVELQPATESIRLKPHPA